MVIALTSDPACGSEIAIAVDDAALGDDGQEALPLLLAAEVQQRHDEHGVQPGDRAAGRRAPARSPRAPCTSSSGCLRGRHTAPAPTTASAPCRRRSAAVRSGKRSVSSISAAIGATCLLDHAADAVAEGQLLFGEVHVIDPPVLALAINGRTI